MSTVIPQHAWPAPTCGWLPVPELQLLQPTVPIGPSNASLRCQYLTPQGSPPIGYELADVVCDDQLLQVKLVWVWIKLLVPQQELRQSLEVVLLQLQCLAQPALRSSQVKAVHIFSTALRCSLVVHGSCFAGGCFSCRFQSRRVRFRKCHSFLFSVDFSAATNCANPFSTSA